MGTSAAETLKEIDEVRERLQADVEALEERLPAPAVLAKRAIGVAAGGGLAGAACWFVLRRVRGRRKPSPVPVVQVLPPELTQRLAARLDDEGLKRGALALGAAWLLFRFAELRQLRRLALLA